MKALVLIFFVLVSLSKPAAAYIGPGIAVALLGYVSWPIAVLIGIFSILVFYPLRFVYRKLRKKSPPAKAEPPGE